MGCATTTAATASVAPQLPTSWSSPGGPTVQWVATLPLAEQKPHRSAFGRFLDWMVGDAGPEEDLSLFARPFGVSASSGEILVADPDGRQVVRLRAGQSKAEVLGCSDQDWVLPMAVGRGAGAIWVADGGAHEIIRMAEGLCSRVGSGALERPTGIAFSGGRVYTVDPPNHVVVGFDAEGREVVRFGALGEGDGALHFPAALAATADGTLLVVDSLNFRISRFSPEGKFLGSFGEAGDGEGAFGRPKGIAVGAGGRILVTDVAHDVVIVFDSQGTFELAFGGTGRGPGRLVMPAGVAVDGGRVYVADSLNARIEEYEIMGENR